MKRGETRQCVWIRKKRQSVAKILIVEDEQSLLDLLRAILEDLGQEVASAANIENIKQIAICLNHPIWES